MKNKKKYNLKKGFVIDENSFMFKWEKGDILLLDNKRWAHSRMNISLKDDRKILTCFGNMYDIRDYNNKSSIMKDIINLFDEIKT